MVAPALYLLAALPAVAATAPAHGVDLVSAQVAVEILRPVIVRQARGAVEGGLENDDADTAQHQVTRRKGLVLIEFQ
ncbi:MAG: hypothetical protein ABIT16_12175 [Croceibacterium sp.]